MGGVQLDLLFTENSCLVRWYSLAVVAVTLMKLWPSASCWGARKASSRVQMLEFR